MNMIIAKRQIIIFRYIIARISCYIRYDDDEVRFGQDQQAEFSAVGLLLPNTFKLFGSPIFRYWVYLMKFFPETCRAH